MRENAVTKSKFKLFLATILLAGLTLIAGCGGTQSRDAGLGVTVIESKKRQPVAKVAGVSLDDAPIDLADFRGKVVVVNWWGSWCAPCRREAPTFAKLSQDKSADAAFVGLLARDSPAAARAFNKKFDIRYPSLVDGDGRLALTFSQVLPIQAVPGTWILDSQGRVAARIASTEVTSTLLRDVIEEVKRK